MHLKTMPRLLSKISESTSSPQATQVEQQSTPDQKSQELDSSPASLQSTDGPEIDETTETLSSIGGETDGNATTTRLVIQEDDVKPSPPSFLQDNWLILIIVALALWGFSQLFVKRGPSFNHQPIDEEKKASIENPRGQFKKAERFMKPKDKEGSTEENLAEVEDLIEVTDAPSKDIAAERRPADPKLVAGDLPKNQQAKTMKTDQPSDDEFDFDLFEGSDSDVFSDEDADKMKGSASDHKRNDSSKRFKTEADVEAPGVKSDELEFNEDEFDDQDSQLSLADSDAEFGFDLDDDEPNNFLDSGNLATGAVSETSPVAGLANSELELSELKDDAVDAKLDDVSLASMDDAAELIDDGSDPNADFGAAAGLAAAPAKKLGFFARMFGGKKKSDDLDHPEADSQVFAETDSTAPMEASFDDADDSFALDEGEIAEPSVVEILDDDDDFDFDSEIEDSEIEPIVIASSDDDGEVEDGLDSSESIDSDEFEFDLEDSAIDGMSGSDIGLTDDTAAPAGQTPVVIEDELNTDESSANATSDDSAEFSLESDSDDSDEFEFDLEDDSAENEKPTSDIGLTDDTASPVGQTTVEIEDEPDTDQSPANAAPDDGAEFNLESDSADSDEFEFDLEDDSAENEKPTSDIGLTDDTANPTGQTPVELGDELDTDESPANASLDDDAEFSLESDADDSDESAIDLGENSAAGDVASDVDLVEDEPSKTVNEQAMTEPDDKPAEKMPRASEGHDSSEFGFGIFDDDAEQSVEASVESSDADAETNFTTSAVAATTALGAGIAGIALAGAGADDGADSSSARESKKQWEAKLSKLENRNQELSSQVAALTQQLDAAGKDKTQSSALQSQLDESRKECEALSKTVDTLTSERDELAKEKAQLAKDNEELAKDKLELTKVKEEMLKEKEEMLKEKDLIDSENKRLREELSALQEQPADWEQQKADLLERQKELEAEKATMDSKLESATNEKETSVGELTSLKEEIAAFADERSTFESEIKTLQAKLSTAEAEPAATKGGSGEDIEDLRSRFKLRLASEHRKRKEAQRQVEQAEAQRNEVAQQLRAAKAEVLTLKANQDDDDFELAD